MTISAGHSRRPKTAIQWTEPTSTLRVRNVGSERRPYWLLGLTAALAAACAVAIVAGLQFRGDGAPGSLQASLIEQAEAATAAPAEALPAEAAPAAPSEASFTSSMIKPAGVVSPLKPADPRWTGASVVAAAVSNAKSAVPAKQAQAKQAQAEPAAAEQRMALVEEQPTGGLAEGWSALAASVVVPEATEALGGGEDGVVVPELRPQRLASAAPDEAQPRQQLAAREAEKPARQQQGLTPVEDVSISLAPVAAASVSQAVNMRAGPNNSSKIVGVIPAGTRVQIASGCRYWCQVVHEGRRGYIYRGFVRGGGSAKSRGQQQAARTQVQAQANNGGDTSSNAPEAAASAAAASSVTTRDN